MNQPWPQRRFLPQAVALACVLVAVPAGAVLRIEPELAVGQTYSDNINLQSGSAKKSDWVTEVTPGVRITARGARSHAHVRAEVQNFLYLLGSQQNRQSLRLFADSHVVAIDDLLFVDATAGVSRQNELLLGEQGSDYNTNANNRQVRTAAVSPYLAWRFGNAGVAELRYRGTYSDATGNTVDDRVVHTTSGFVRNSEAWGRLGWGLSGSRERSDAAGVRPIENTMGQATLYYALLPSLRLHGSVGRERNNFRTQAMQSNATYGAGFNWTPMSRTSLSASGTRRFFGNGYDVRLAHRMPRTLFEARLIRDVTSAAQAYSVTGALFHQRRRLELENQYGGQLSGQALEDRIRQELLNEVYAGELPPPQYGLSYLSNDYVLQRGARASVLFSGVRNSVLLAASRNERESLSEGSVAGFSQLGDFALYSRTRETQGEATWTHNLTPVTTASATGLYTLAKGENSLTGNRVDHRRTRQLILSLEKRLSPDTRGVVSYRYSRSTGAAQYIENAITVRVVHRF